VASERTVRDLVLAGSLLRPKEYLAMRVGLALGAAILGGVALSIAGLPPILVYGASLALAMSGWLLPRFVMSYRRQRRLRQIEGQLSDALTAMAKSLRVGQGVLQAIGYAAQETPAPLGPELQIVLRDLQLGVEAERAFADLSARVGSSDLDIAITAIIIQRTSGGNLSEILEGVSRTIRARARLQGEVHALTSRQRLTGNLVAAIPLLTAAAFITLNPKLGSLLINTTPGQISAAAGIAFEIFGIVLMRRLSRVEV
jgi:tight adherence protein B